MQKKTVVGESVLFKAWGWRVKTEDYAIIQGDAAEKLAEISSNSIDFVLTSPPYDNLRDYQGHGSTWNSTKWENVIKNLYRVIKPGCFCVWVVADATINGSETGTSFKQALYAMDCGFNLFDTMIYHKESQPTQQGSRYEQHFEYMFVFSKGKAKPRKLLQEPARKAGEVTVSSHRDKKGNLREFKHKISDMKYKGNVWKYAVGGCSIPKQYRGHPATFPIQLAIDHIESWTIENDLILDPFAGSGTTGVAALQLKRRFLGIEINENYADMIRTRIQDGVQTRLI